MNTTEPTIDEIFDTPIKTAPTSDEATMLKLIKSQVEQLISDQVAKARIDERSQAQQYLHGLTITPESQHLFDVLSRDNHNRIATLNGVKNK